MSDLRKIQTHLGIPADGILGPQTLAAIAKALGMKHAPSPVPTIPDDYCPMLTKIESGDQPYIKAITSSASGLYQFIRSTWEGEGGKWGPNMTKAFGGLMPSQA
mgnify:FL=1